MAQVLELQFLKDDGKVTTLSIEAPIIPVDEGAVNTVMDTILASGVFEPISTPTARKKGARLVDHTVTDINLSL
ncbi:DUF2922 domain-containing protein [Bacillus sp. 165]|uniref:DUF2922 domain-containing protein n=1 Tax=Bacillus sp. 165 TaxID=1529117 RepID=UPI001ADD38A9|nr:DUF2922 domain-containing protein [Bacillus sp. 165]MBO9129986.1 DUF2922 domain-containing protein [Bacillus sp. 165]